MKEALSVIASAWSVAFMLIFVGLLKMDTPTEPVMHAAYHHTFLLAFGGTITGAGWLTYRSELKKKRKAEEGSHE